MNCTKCGKEIPEGDQKICDECQKKLLEEISSEEQKDSKDNASKNKKMKKEKNKKEDNKKDNKEKKDSDSKGTDAKEKEASKRIIICICVLLILLILALLYYFFAIGVNNKTGNTIGNIRNYGYAAKQGNWIYYLAPNEDSSQVGIFKVKNNGKDKQELFMTDMDIVSINVYKNYIYFIGVSSEAYSEEDELDNKIYRMKLDGSNLEAINDNEFNDNCYEIYVINNEIYYIGVDAEICKMDLDGSNKSIVKDNDTGYLGITEKYIIYNVAESEDATDYVTYIMNIDGTDPRPIIKDTRLYSVNIEGNYVYYTDSEKKIYRTRIDSNEEELVFDTEAYNLNTSEGYAYYLNYLDAENEDYTVCIFRIKLDGTSESPEKIKELETYSSFIDVVGKWVIYMDSNNTSGFINLVNVDGSGEEIQLYSLNYEELYSSMYTDDEDYSDVSVESADTEDTSEDVSSDSTVDNTNTVENTAVQETNTVVDSNTIDTTNTTETVNTNEIVENSNVAN